MTKKNPITRLGRNILKALDRVNRHISYSDSLYLDKDAPMSKLISHEKFLAHLVEIGNKPGMRILEVGSREVTGRSKARELFDKAEYIGMDYYEGPNVDIVGDAHKLSEYFDEPFDLIYASAVFEHLAMPWVVATEIAKILKVGGTLAIETHFTYCLHERPWHFFHYTDMALKALFSPALGFECIEAGFSNPVVGKFSKFATPYLKKRKMTGLYCHVSYLGQKFANVTDFDWQSVQLNEVVNSTAYPKPRHAD